MEKLPVDKIYSQSIVIPFHKNKALLEYSLNPLIDFILDKMEAKKEQKKELAKAEAVPYRRVDPNVKTKQNKKGDK